MKHMDEEERENFRVHLKMEERNIGFGVLGGIFSEGIDLTNEKLIGEFSIIGTGLPQVCK